MTVNSMSVLLPTSKGCPPLVFLMVFLYLKAFNKHPLDVAGMFCSSGVSFFFLMGLTKGLVGDFFCFFELLKQILDVVKMARTCAVGVLRFSSKKNNMQLTPQPDVVGN